MTVHHGGCEIGQGGKGFGVLGSHLEGKQKQKGYYNMSWMFFCVGKTLWIFIDRSLI